jgi:hypothetical protein
MKIAKSIFPEQPWLTYATGALLVICPYFIQASRIGLDCNLALGFSTLFLYLLICALEGGKTTAYIFAGVAGGLLLYTYALTWIFVPVFLILAVCYLLWTKKMTLKKWVIMAIPFGLLAFPLILMQMVNLFGWDELHIGIFTITKLGTYRISEIGAASWSNLVRAMESIFASDALAYNTIPGGNALYKISIPIFILGFCGTLGRFFLSIYRRQCDTRCLVFLWFLSVLYLEVHIEANANKINAIFFSVVLIAMEGISVLEHVGGRLRDCIAVVLTGAYFICFASFATYYYGGSYTAETYLLPYFDTTVEEAVQFIQADEELAGKATYMAEDKIYYAVSGFPTPYQYQEALMQTDGELPSCGNFYFNGLGAIEDDCNYIVRDTFDEYKEELRQNGFTEIVYGHYSLFYQKTR